MELFKTACDNIHIAFAGWTPHSQLSLLGVNCFFLGQRWWHRSLLLALPPVSYARHTGGNLANKVADVLAGWGLDENM